MNIAHLLPYSAHFPLKKHNGRYEWALRLAGLQTEAGHTVTIYSAPGSRDSNTKLRWKSSNYDYRHKTVNNLALIATALQDTSHDIYHTHFDFLHYFIADSTTKPIVQTQHWFPTEDVAKAASFNTRGNAVAVPPTRYLAEENKKLGILSTDTIPHGIDLNLFKPTAKPIGDRLIFVGRIAPHKGVLEAVQIARTTHQDLDIVGKVKETDQAYWQRISPLIDGKHIKYLGPKTQTEVAALLREAKALIFPTQAPEAFGQVTIEAQACGTPVIINDLGASKELVDHGKSGFMVKTEAEYAEAIDQIGNIDRNYCRKFAEQFDIDTMFNSYELLYKKLITKR